MSTDSDDTDPRLARRLARDLQKEGASDEKGSKNEMGSELNSNPPLNAQACDQTEPTGTSYPTVAASGDAPMAAFQGSLPEYVQALQLMGFSREEQLKAVNAMFLNREAARQQQPPAQQQDDSVQQPAPVVQQSSSSSASAAALHSTSSASSQPALQSSTSTPSSLQTPSSASASIQHVLQPLQYARQRCRS